MAVTLETEEKKVNRSEQEDKRVEAWRRFIFRDELTKAGMSEIMADDVEALVRSKASWNDVRILSNDGCPPDLIIKILV